MVPFRPVQSAKAFLAGLYPSDCLHLVQVAAGNGIPEHRRSYADEDDRDQDATNRWTISGIYALPFGKGQRFMKINGLADRIVGGWQLQGVWTYQSGFPVPFGAYNITSGVTSGDIF